MKAGEAELERLKAKWKAEGLHKSKVSRQGWCGETMLKRISAISMERDVEDLERAIERYAASLARHQGGNRYAVMFSTFFGPGKEVWREFVDAEAEPVRFYHTPEELKIMETPLAERMALADERNARTNEEMDA